MASGTGARRTEGPTSPSGTGARRTEGPTSPSGTGARRTEGPTSPSGFVPPPYPYDRLGALAEIASARPGGVVDLSIGTPCDPPPAAVVRALSSSDSERGYPPSIGTPELRSAVRRWLDRRFGVDVPIAQIAACVGTKELVGTLPQWLRLRSPDRDTVLYPAISYPTYAMGAILAGCRPVAVPTDARFRLRLDAIDPDDAARALVLWVNSPGNPTGALDDLGAAAAWGRARGIPVFSDECYCEFTWEGPPRTILEHGLDGVVAVHSLSKRSNLAGLRVGFYAGDGELVAYLQEVRKHVGLLVPGPAQAAGVVALDDDGHVEEQRQRYRERLELLAGALSKWAGLDIDLPSGGFYLWFPAGDGWEFTERVARGRRRAGQPRRVLRDRGCRPRPRRRGTTSRPSQPRRRAPRGDLTMSFPPPSVPQESPTTPTKIKPGKGWYWLGALLLAGGLLGGLALAVAGFLSLKNTRRRLRALQGHERPGVGDGQLREARHLHHLLREPQQGLPGPDPER